MVAHGVIRNYMRNKTYYKSGRNSSYDGVEFGAPCGENTADKFGLLSRKAETRQEFEHKYHVGRGVKRVSEIDYNKGNSANDNILYYIAVTLAGMSYLAVKTQFLTAFSHHRGEICKGDQRAHTCRHYRYAYCISYAVKELYKNKAAYKYNNYSYKLFNYLT